MTATIDVIRAILKDSNYHLDLFSYDATHALRERVFQKEVRGKQTAFVTCIVRNKDVQLKPEEIVRQLYATRLIEQYGYPKKRLCFEYKVTFGREKKAPTSLSRSKNRSSRMARSGWTKTAT